MSPTLIGAITGGRRPRCTWGLLALVVLLAQATLASGVGAQTRTAATSQSWSTTLRVEQVSSVIGYDASLDRGVLTNDQFALAGTIHTVTELTVGCAGRDSDCVVNFAVIPRIDAGSEQLVLRLRQVWLNLADARADGDVWTWTGVRVRLRVGDIVPVGLREYPDSFSVRSLDGWGNNTQSAELGSVRTPLLRLAPPHDTGSSGVQADIAGPREISNIVAAQSGSAPNSIGATDMVWQWGQFLDHDISLTPEHAPAESLPIPIPTGDPVFDPASTGTRSMEFRRSMHDNAAAGTRQQLNMITSFVDASNVYGSSLARTQALRTNDGTGRLRTSGDSRHLPFNDFGLDNDSGGRGVGSSRTDLFVAGDVRANEQVGLSALHTLFVREHNRLAAELADEHGGLAGHEIFEMARKIVGAQMQVITYNEFLPVLLGPDAIASYDGYDPTVDASIANEFSAAAYRVGHTMLAPELLVIDHNGVEQLLSLADAFFAPSMVSEMGISGLLRGLSTQLTQQVDAELVDQVRNMLFGPPTNPGRDLAALNIQRGRDHELAPYRTTRTTLGLSPTSSFGDISSDSDVQNKLREAYGDVDRVDLWTGGLAEDHVAGAMVGETFFTIMADQFRRLRDGDRFWFQNDPWFVANPDVMNQTQSTTLADIIRRNTPIEDEIPDNVFLITASDDEPSHSAMAATDPDATAGDLDDDCPAESAECPPDDADEHVPPGPRNRWPLPSTTHPSEPL